LTVLVLGNAVATLEYEGRGSNPTYVKYFPYPCHTQTCSMSTDTSPVIKRFAFKPIYFSGNSHPLNEVNYENQALQEICNRLQHFYCIFLLMLYLGIFIA